MSEVLPNPHLASLVAGVIQHRSRKVLKDVIRKHVAGRRARKRTVVRLRVLPLTVDLLAGQRTEHPSAVFTGDAGGLVRLSMRVTIAR